MPGRETGNPVAELYLVGQAVVLLVKHVDFEVLAQKVDDVDVIRPAWGPARHEDQRRSKAAFRIAQRNVVAGLEVAEFQTSDIRKLNAVFAIPSPLNSFLQYCDRASEANVVRNGSGQSRYTAPHAIAPSPSLELPLNRIKYSTYNNEGPPMSGLIALLDDVAGLAKVAAASVDDITAAAAKAGTKAAGVVIDDTAVTPRYVTGISPARELPMIGRIALGSLRNKIVVLLPALLLLQAFLPRVITPLLMVGGAYLAYEGAEKVVHLLLPDTGANQQDADTSKTPEVLEEEKVAGAIKTDFILSAEIMTIALSQIENDSLWVEAAALAIVGLLVTVGVYGAVALLVKIDDIGLSMAKRSEGLRSFGMMLVRGMPKFLSALALVGTVAMLWVGGNILTHGLHETIWAAPYEVIHHWATSAADAIGAARGLVVWTVTAICDAIVALFVGTAIVLALRPFTARTGH